MAEYKGKWDEVENELFDIAAEVTALGDIIPGLFLNYEDMESETPKGVKILLTDIRKRIEDFRNYAGGNFRRIETEKGG
jgi:hypothetical protein